MTWFFYALTTAVLFSAWSLLSRILSVKSENPRAFSVVYNILAAGCALLLLAFHPQAFRPLPVGAVIVSILALLIWSVYGRTEFYATKYVEASTLSILSRVAPLVTFSVSILVFRESATAVKIVAAGLIMGGNVLAVYQKGGARITRGVGYALITATAAGLGWVCDKYLVTFYPLALYAALSYAAPNFLVALFPPLPKGAIGKELRRGSWKILILAGCAVGGYFFQLKAFLVGEASRVILVTSTSSVLTILLGIILLGETNNLKRKILAGLLVFIGIVLME